MLTNTDHIEVVAGKRAEAVPRWMHITPLKGPEGEILIASVRGTVGASARSNWLALARSLNARLREDANS